VRFEVVPKGDAAAVKLGFLVNEVYLDLNASDVPIPANPRVRVNTGRLTKHAPQSFEIVIKLFDCNGDVNINIAFVGDAPGNGAFVKYDRARS
jgi:hypothetical protein